MRVTSVVGLIAHCREPLSHELQHHIRIEDGHFVFKALADVQRDPHTRAKGFGRIRLRPRANDEEPRSSRRHAGDGLSRTSPRRYSDVGALDGVDERSQRGTRCDPKLE